jgi:hypothetical protein
VSGRIDERDLRGSPPPVGMYYFVRGSGLRDAARLARGDTFALRM